MVSRKSSSEPNNFMGLVQDHERSWGTENYPNRPSLEEILKAGVILLWYPATPDPKVPERFTVTLHDNLDAVEDHVSKVVFRLSAQTPKQRLGRIFVNGKEFRITRMKLMFEEMKRS